MDRIISNVKVEYSLAMQNERSLQDQMRRAQEDSLDLSVASTDYKILKSEIEEDRRIYDLILSRIKEIDLNQETLSNNLRVLDEAILPVSPVRPRRAVNLLAGALLGLMLGTVAGATLSGRTIQRFVHYKRIAMIGVTFAILCLGVLSLVAGHASLLIVEILTTCVGLGSGTTFPVATVSVQNAVDQAHLGVATGMLTFLRSLGSALGVAVLAAIALGLGVPLGAEMGNAHVTHVSDPFPFAVLFCAMAAMMLAGAIITALMPHKALRSTMNTAPVGD